MTISAHRIRNDVSQTDQDVLEQVASGEIWGKEHKLNGLFPAVKAYPDDLPTEELGINFTTEAKPNGGTPTLILWRLLDDLSYPEATPPNEQIFERSKSGDRYAAIFANIVNLHVRP